jgi:hypothetical protein
MASMMQGVTGMSEAIAVAFTLNQIQRFFEPEVNPQPAPVSLRSRLFLSPLMVQKLSDSLHRLESAVRNEWDELPNDLRKDLKSFANQLISGKRQLSESDSGSKLRTTTFTVSILWASLWYGKNFHRELVDSFRSLIDAVIEQFSQEAPEETGNKEFVIHLKSGEMRKIKWGELDSYIESGEVAFQPALNQRPRRARPVS